MATIAKKWSRTTKGLFAQIFVAKNINYTTQTVYSAFLANAALGEMGVFNATSATDATLQTTLLAAGQKFFIAMQCTGTVKKTPTYTMGTEVTPRKVLYVAPVNAQSAIGWNGAGGNFNNGTIVAGVSNYEFAILEVTEGNDPYPVWNYNYTPKTNDTIVECAIALAKLVNDTTNPVYKNNLPLITCNVRTNGTVTSFTLTGTTPTITFTQGSNIGVLGGTTPSFNGAVGQYIITNPGAVPGVTNNNTYKITATVAGTSITLDRPWIDPTIIMTQAQVQGASGGLNQIATVTAAGLIFNAINANETFRMAVRGDLVNADRWDFLAYTRGLGIDFQVLQLEQEALLAQGNTARATVFGDAAYGNPDLFAVAGETYDYFYFDYVRTSQMTNQFVPATNLIGDILLAAARSAGNIKTNLQTIFGV